MQDIINIPPFLLMMIILILQMSIKVPIAVAMGVSSLFYLIITGSSLSMVSQYLVINLNSFTLLGIPFFVLAGELMNNSGIAERIIAVSKVFVGHIKGGLAHVNIVTSIILAGMSGSATSDAAMTCRVLVPEMEKSGYTRPFSAAVTAGSATIGPIIPPSIPMVLLGGINQLSVGRLFLGGFFPGLLMGVTMMIIVAFMAKSQNFPSGKKVNLSEAYIAIKEGILPMFTPVIILGGMGIGLFTPTEAAVVAVIYVLFLGVVIYRTLDFHKIYLSLLYTAEISARIMLLIALAGTFGWILTVEQVANSVVNIMSDFVNNPIILLMLINILLLFLGCFINLATIVILLSPIVFPLIYEAGIDPIHFGVIMILNLMIGQLTPPVGIMSFVVMSVANVSLKDFIINIFPFFIAIIIALLLVTYFPEIVLFLPNLIMGPRVL